jgi:GNAT superfamily N-acetyltransferase
MIKIREATIKDVPTILHLIKDLAEFEKLSHEVTADTKILEKNLFTNRKCAEVLLAEIEVQGQSQMQAIGCAIFFHSFSTFLGKPGLYLEDLFVRPEARGKGAGMTLLKELAKIALQRDCGRMEWSVLDWNQKAIDLYESIGAQSMDEWTVMRLTGDKLHQLAHS